MILIKSKMEGFRRCGIAHTIAAKAYPDDRFTEAELQALQAEPMLVVTVRVRPDKPPAGPVIPADAGFQEEAAATEGKAVAVKGKTKGKK